MDYLQWDRYAELLILSDKITIDLSPLSFKFETNGSVIDVPKVLKVRVYNVAPTTIKSIMEEGLEIQLSAGYVNNYSIIFSGQIRQITCGKENGTDTFLDIQATDNDALFKDGFVSFTLAEGSSQNQRLTQVVQNTNTGTQNTEIAKIDEGTKLPRGRVYHGKTTNFLRTAAAQMECTYFSENNDLKVVPIDGYLNDDVIVINRQTGMIGLPQQTLQGIQVKCLLNPNVKIGCAIQLDNNSVQLMQQSFGVKEEAKWSFNTNPLNNDGIYKVLTLTHDGMIRGTNWYTNITCFTIGKSTATQIKYTPG